MRPYEVGSAYITWYPVQLTFTSSQGLINGMQDATTSNLHVNKRVKFLVSSNRLQIPGLRHLCNALPSPLYV